MGYNFIELFIHLLTERVRSLNSFMVCVSCIKIFAELQLLSLGKELWVQSLLSSALVMRSFVPSRRRKVRFGMVVVVWMTCEVLALLVGPEACSPSQGRAGVVQGGSKETAWGIAYQNRAHRRRGPGNTYLGTQNIWRTPEEEGRTGLLLQQRVNSAFPDACLCVSCVQGFLGLGCFSDDLNCEAISVRYEA